MTNTLGNAADVEQIRRRSVALNSGSARRWGQMSVGGMMCHLHDSYQLALGGGCGTCAVAVAGAARVCQVSRAAHSVAVGKKLKTMPEVRQGYGGTPPGVFAEDQIRLLDTLGTLSAHPGLSQAPHPFFGWMSREDWLRWGYLHADHHLSQFSA